MLGIKMVKDMLSDFAGYTIRDTLGKFLSLIFIIFK